MARKIISAAAGQWLADNPPASPTGRGSAAARTAAFGALTINRTIELKMEGGSSTYLLDSVGSKDLVLGSAVGEPVHGGAPLCFASVDSIRFSQANQRLSGGTGNDYGTGNYAFEFWWRQPPFTLNGNDGYVPPWGPSDPGEIFVLGVENNSTRVILGLRYLQESNTYTGPYPSSHRQGPGGDVNFFIPWEWAFPDDGKIHNIWEVREAATRANYLVIIDGIPIADVTFPGTGVGIIQNFDGTSARPSINGNASAADNERAGLEAGYMAFYDNGEELNLQKVRELFEVSSLDNQNMLEIPCWVPLDSENVTIEDIKYRKITMGDVLDSTGARSGAIPRSQGKKVYFEIEILDQGDSTTAIRPGIRRMITAADVGDQTTVGEDGNEHHFYIDGTDLRVDRATLVHAGATDQSTGRVYGFAIDWGSGNFWVSEDGAWLQGDPNTGALPSGTLDIDTAWAAHVWNNGLDGNAVALLISDEAALNYPLPVAPDGAYQAWKPFVGALEPEPYGEVRREFAAQKRQSEYIHEYKFEGGPNGVPRWIDDTAGNRPPFHDTLTATGTLPYENEPIGCDPNSNDVIGVLPDSSFSASSGFSAAYEARDARLNNTESWAPATTVIGEFLIIDMLEVRTLVGMQTQGGATVAEWVTTCLVEVSLDNSTYTPIVDGILNFNVDQTSIVENLITPVPARYVKFTPQSFQAYIDMRVELLVAPRRVSQASQSSILFPSGVAAEFNGNQGDTTEELRAFEFHWSDQKEIPTRTQYSLFDSTNNGNINLGNGRNGSLRNFPAFNNNFNDALYFESNVDLLNDNKPHQLFESCDPDDDTQGFVCVDGMPVVPDLLTAGSVAGGICANFNPTTNGTVRINGDANDGDNARANARYGFCRSYRGISKQFTLMDVRRIFEAGAIIEPARAKPVGVQDGTFLDTQMDASTVQNTTNRRAEDARLHATNFWQPSSSSTSEWLKLNFGNLVLVDSIIMQGGTNLGLYVSSFQLEYNEDGSDTWISYNSGEVISNSPNNGNDTIFHKLIPFQCRALRIRPQSWSGGIAIRTEVFTRLIHTGRLQDMLPAPRWFELDSVNCTVGGTEDIDLTLGDVTDNTGARSGAIPRNGKVYFEMQILAQGDTGLSTRAGIRKLIQDGNVGFEADAPEDGYHALAPFIYDGENNQLTTSGTILGPVNGRTIQFAIDWNTGGWWMQFDGAGWVGSGGFGNPETGANPLSILDTDANWAAHCRNNGVLGNSQIRLASSARDVKEQLPEGYRVWADDGDPFWVNVGSLLHFENGIKNNAPSDRNFTAFNGAAPSATQAKFGTQSLQLTSTGNEYLRVTNGGFEHTPGTGDFTIEFWVWSSVANNDKFIWDMRGGTSGDTEIHVTFGGFGGTTAGTIRYATQAVNIGGTTVLNDSAWHHVAIVRRQGVVNIYVDGTSENSAVDAVNHNRTGGSNYLGTNSFSLGSQGPDCFIDDFRYTNGIARYTANFTPPALPFENA